MVGVDRVIDASGSLRHTGGALQMAANKNIAWDKELSVPASQAEQLKAFYRDIADDERNSAVLKKAAR